MQSLLEREDELGTLSAVVDRAAGGTGSVVFVCGEAGIGKTSLVRALRDRARSRATFLFGACEPLSVPIPLGPLREITEAAGAADLIELGTDDRLALARALLEALSSRTPAVAVIEDVHWADPMTLDLLRLLARRVEDSQIAMIVTYRDDEVAANPALSMLLGDLATSPATRRMVLRPLSDSAVRELAGPEGIDAAELARATGGNPFLVVESIAAGSRLPASIRDAALARAGRLSPAARSVVDAAAVVGQRCSLALLQSLIPDSGGAVEEALARGVLIADGPVLGFRHELIREAIETSIAPPRRTELHRRVVSALAEQAAGADNVRLAHHAELGGLLPEACRYARLAALEAERVGALREARLQADRALRMGAELAPDERFELLIQYSRAANFSSTRLEHTASAAQEAVSLADQLGDPLKQGRALVMLAWTQWSLDRVHEAKTSAEAAIAVLEPTADAAALARAYATYIRMEATAFEPAVAIESGTRALELASTAGLAEIEIDIAISVGLARGQRGEAAAVASLADALRAARAAGLAIQTVRAYVNLMVVGAALRDHELVDRTAREARAVFDEYHTPVPAHAIESYLARSLLDRGRFDDARAIAQRSRTTWHAEVPGARAIEGLIAARRGDAGAGEIVAAAWDELQGVAEAARHGMVRAALVETAWLQGDDATALGHLQAARASAATARFARPAGDLAIWASRYEVAFAVPENAPAPVLAELGGDWRGAIRAWQELDAPYEAALAALPGDEHAARQALGALHRLGATGAARAFVRDRSARGARPARGPRPSTLANAAGLTRREQQVLDQLATGATNVAIAATLQLSERTVAHHVSAVLGKLGAANRVTAIAHARARGLLGKDGPLDQPR